MKKYKCTVCRERWIDPKHVARKLDSDELVHIHTFVDGNTDGDIWQDAEFCDGAVVEVVEDE